MNSDNIALTSYAKHRRATQFALAFIIASLFSFLVYGIYIFIVFFQPNQIVTGAVGLASAVVAILVAIPRFLPPNVTGLFSEYVFALYSRLVSALTVIIIAWIAIIGGSVMMRKDIFGRFIYVASLQKSMKQGIVDGVSLPDSAELARAFETFPNRREVPFLLTRSSRLLLQAGRNDLFRAFERQFLSHLNLDNLLEDLCKSVKKTDRTDGLLFLTTIAGEAVSLSSAASKAEYKAAIESLEKLVPSLDKCRTNSLRAKVKSIRLKDTINSFYEKIDLSSPYDISKESQELDGLIEITKDESEILSFWQSHEAQEYLDFKAFDILNKLHAEGDKAISDTVDRQKLLKKLTSFYETILILRQSSVHQNDVIWNEVPFKLNLFFAFMTHAKITSLVADDATDLFTRPPDLNSAIAELTTRKAFEQFNTLSGWYAGTPLDFNLNGSAVENKINEWLKSDW